MKRTQKEIKQQTEEWLDERCKTTGHELSHGSFKGS